MKYRSEIDGLRTIAVVPVILYHAGFTIFQGGFVGVDVFFVISGYLITTILIGELERDDFSIVRFYERRARRILPALFTVIVCTIPIAWIQLDPIRFTDFSESIIATMLFVSNFLFWSESGYFDLDAENKPLLHTWSLAVEEQYYIIVPVMLFVLWRYGRRATLSTFIVLTLLSFALCIWGSRNASSANFYLLPFRMWELFVGSICAFIATQPRFVRGNQMLAGAGLALIVASIFLIGSDMRFPGWVTLGPVIGSALIILYARTDTLVARALSLKGMVWIGLISYSLYLWHQPIFALVRLRFGGDAPVWTMAALVVLSFVLAYLTWLFIEQPFRKRRAGGGFVVSRSMIFTASGTVMAAFIAFGVFGVASDGAQMRFPPGYATVLQGYQDKPQEAICKVEYANRLPQHPVPECLHVVAEEEAPSVMLLGDSHAWAISEEIAKDLNAEGVSVYVATHSACLPVPGIYDLDADVDNVDRCDQFINTALDWAEDNGIEQLILAGRYTSSLHGTVFNNEEGGVERSDGPDRIRDAIYDPKGTANDPRQVRLDRIRAAIPERMAKISQRFDIVVIEPIPAAGWHVPGTAMSTLLRSGEVPDLSTSYEVVEARLKIARNALFEIFDHPHGNVEIVPVADLFCSAETGRCDTIVDNVPLYFDDDHLSGAGAALLAPRVTAAVKAQRAVQLGLAAD